MEEKKRERVKESDKLSTVYCISYALYLDVVETRGEATGANGIIIRV